jgi:hypothetical protein
MFGSTILDTVIAMSFVFLLVSLLVTTINEMIAAALRSRAKWLRWGIERLLGTAYSDQLFAHPLIQSFSPAPNARGLLAKDITGPSYIPSRSFATVLLDIVAKGADAAGMRIAISGLSDTELSKTLIVLLDDAKDDVETFKQNIEIWFNNGMDRVGGWYKRRSQLVVGIIAFIVTIVVNVDALLILQQINSQTGLRDALVAQAKTFAERPPVTIALTAPAAATTPAEASTNKSAKTDEKASSAEMDFAKVQAQLSVLNLPIGWFCLSSNWPCEDSTKAAKNTSDRDTVNKFRRENFLVFPWGGDANALDTILFHIAGWILTALAASLGAPFWFDTLNKFMSIRSVGKAPEEKPKPPKEVPAPLGPGQIPAPQK